MIRSRRGWFAAVLAVAAALVAVRSCGSDAPPAGEPGARVPPDAGEAARSSVQPSPRPRRRSAADEGAPSTTNDAARTDDPASAPAAGASTAPTPTAKLHGVRVLRADGTPAAGATIALDQRPLWDDWPGPHMWMLRSTDADGQAQLPRRDAPLYVRQGSDVGWTYKPGSVVPLPDVRLRPGVVVRGRTIDSDSLPLAGADVRAEMFPPGAGGSIVVQAASNSEGEFELPPLPFDENGSGGQDIELVAYAEGLVPGHATTTRTEATKSPVVLTLHRGGALRGRLVRADERPLSRVRVLLAGTHIAASPDEEGRFVLRLPAAGGEVIVQDAFFATSESVFRPAAGTFVAARRLGAFRGDIGDRDLGDVVVDGGNPVRGVVVLMKSEPGWEKAFPDVVPLLNSGPVAGARVTAVLAGTEVLSVTTDAQGAFEMPLSGDAHDLVVNERSSNRFGGPPAVEGVRGGDPDVRIVRGLMGIRVRLRDENGGRIEPAGVHLQAHLHGQTGGVAYADGYHGAAELNAARSEVRVQLPAAGAYDVVVSDTRREFEAVKIESIDVRADRDAEIDVRMRRKP